MDSASDYETRGYLHGSELQAGNKNSQSVRHATIPAFPVIFVGGEESDRPTIAPPARTAAGHCPFPHFPKHGQLWAKMGND
jgi:hypothetical protein